MNNLHKVHLLLNVFNNVFTIQIQEPVMDFGAHGLLEEVVVDFKNGFQVAHFLLFYFFIELSLEFVAFMYKLAMPRNK